MKTTFQPYLSNDRNSCLQVFDSNVPRFFRIQERAEFERSLDSNQYPYFVIETQDSIVGCGGYAVRDGFYVADLCWGMVDDAFHGKRLGELLLLGRLFEITKHKEIRGVRLATSQHTAGFFQRYGFVVKSNVRDGFAEGLDNVEMFHDLTVQSRNRIANQWQLHLTTH